MEGASRSRPRVRNLPGEWHLTSPTEGPGGWLPSPRRGQRAAGDAGCPALAGRGSSGCGFRVLPAADPGQEAPRRADKQTPTALDSLHGPANSPRDGGRGGADSPGRLRVQLRHGRAAGDRGLHDPVPPTPTTGFLLRGAVIAGPEVRGGGLGRGRRRRRRRTTRSGTGMGTQEALAPSAGVQEGGTARDRGRRRPRAASSPERRRPPVDPPSASSAPPPGLGRGPELRAEGTRSLLSD